MNNIDYFKNNAGFDRFFLVLKEKYKSIGRCSGFIALNKISEKEALALSLFLSRNYLTNMDIRINLNDFNKKTLEYFNVDLTNILLLYFNNEIITNKEKNKILSDDKQNYFDKIMNRFVGTFCYEWLTDVLINKKYPYSKIIQRYNDNKDKLFQQLIYVGQALNNLPYLEKNVLPLNVFASSITHDSHYFDLDTANSNLFIDALSDMFSYKVDSREDKIHLLKLSGITIDEISNFIITYGLSINNFEGINTFNEAYLPTMLSIMHMRKFDQITAYNNKVFILENPIILWMILSYKMPCSVIITSGNPNTVLYHLLDKLGTKCELYYNGDIDPEGLLIAAKLQEKYPHMKLFGYDKEVYLNNYSDILISDSRIKKLDKINNVELDSIKNSLKKNRYPFYQENNIENIINYIRDTNF